MLRQESFPAIPSRGQQILTPHASTSALCGNRHQTRPAEHSPCGNTRRNTHPSLPETSRAAETFPGTSEICHLVVFLPVGTESLEGFLLPVFIFFSSFCPL